VARVNCVETAVDESSQVVTDDPEEMLRTGLVGPEAAVCQILRQHSQKMRSSQAVSEGLAKCFHEQK
jgi:hypothetical protein